MQRSASLTIGVALTAALAFGASARAQCNTVIDFENYADGTSISSQYPGVTFSAQPNTACDPEIDVPFLETSSGTKALIVGSCPPVEFSPDYLRMVFDEFQELVSFTFSSWGTPDYPTKIRAYTTSSGTSGLIYSETIDGGDGVVFSLAVIGSPGGPRNIRRVEVETLVVGVTECIDDLRFGVPDTTPPVARIDTPVYGGCHCSGSLTVTGLACDADGGYGYDQLEYRSVSAAPDAPWIFIDTVVGSEVCTPGFLYDWSTASVPHGRYFLRLTAVNECGLKDSAFASVFIDKDFGHVDVASPPDNSAVCGTVEFFGTVNDGCQCFDSYRVEFATSIGGPYAPVDPEHSAYGEDVKNGVLAFWDTEAMGLVNDLYYIRITGEDTCGNTDTQVIKLHLENGPLCGCPTDIDHDGLIGFEDLLRVLSTWGPCP